MSVKKFTREEIKRAGIAMKATTVIIYLLMSFNAMSQSNPFKFNLEGQGIITTDDAVPFWLRSNRYGSVPISGPSVSLIGQVRKDYDTTKRRVLDWGVALEGRANLGKSTQLLLIEGYGKVKLGIFEIKGGRIKETMGLADTLLSSGNFAVSGTALGIPKVQIAIPEFYAIPIFGKLISLKGHFAHGWLGETAIQKKRVDIANTYFHQKAIWGRIGKPEWKFKFYGGFNDNVFWGDERKIFEGFALTDWQSYQSVALGKNWAFSKVGNHAGSIDIRLEYEFKNVVLAAYRQNFYEVGALYHLANIADGLNGIVLTNKTTDGGKLGWKKILFEFLYTKNQAGETWSKPTPTGNENYLNHYLYTEGWSYKGTGLGTPFITQANLAREGQSSLPVNYFINNRLVALHTGLTGVISKWDYVAKVSYSRNHGTHQTKQSFVPVNQFSAMIEAQKAIRKNLNVGGIIAFDAGRLLKNSGAAVIKVSTSF